MPQHPPPTLRARLIRRVHEALKRHAVYDQRAAISAAEAVMEEAGLTEGPGSYVRLPCEPDTAEGVLKVVLEALNGGEGWSLVAVPPAADCREAVDHA